MADKSYATMLKKVPVLEGLGRLELEPIAAEDDALEALDHQGGDMETAGRVDVSHDMTRFDAIRLRQLIENHAHYTNSPVAQNILGNWETYLPKFVKVMPVDYRRALVEIQAAQRKPPQAPQPLKGVTDHG